jgi:hypothetical protein
MGVLATVLSPAPIRSVLRPCSGGTTFAGALDSAIDRRPADGEHSGRLCGDVLAGSLQPDQMSLLGGAESPVPYSVPCTV